MNKAIELKLRHLFRLLDGNGDGTLEQADLEVVAERLAVARGHAIDSSEHAEIRDLYRNVWDALIRSAQKQGSGGISADEYVRYYEGVLASPERITAKVDAAQSLFALVDERGDGKIVADELRKFHAAYGIDATTSAEVFKAYDAAQRGYIEAEEFVGHVRDFFTSEDLASPGTVLFGPLEPPHLA